MKPIVFFCWFSMLMTANILKSERKAYNELENVDKNEQNGKEEEEWLRWWESIFT